MDNAVAKRIVNECKQCFRQEGLNIVGDSEEDDTITFYSRGNCHPGFATISCTYARQHQVVELSMVTIDSFSQQDMDSLLELMNLLNIAEMNSTWSITPYLNVEIRSAIAVNPESLDKAQLKKTLERFLECASRCYPAIVNQATGEKSPQDIMDKLVEENRNFFI